MLQGVYIKITQITKILFQQNSALQSEIKALKVSNNEATVREQKALSECQSLRDSLKESRNLEGSLREKDAVIKSLESEVSVNTGQHSTLLFYSTVHFESKKKYYKITVRNLAF